MLDLFIAKRYLSKNKEGFVSFNGINNTIATVIMFVIGLALGIWAAMLSWEANALAGWGFVPKLIFALFSFLTSVSYLLTYLIYKLDLVMPLKAAAALAAARAALPSSGPQPPVPATVPAPAPASFP